MIFYKLRSKKQRELPPYSRCGDYVNKKQSANIAEEVIHTASLDNKHSCL